EVDEEVEKAKKFDPPLKTYIIATTAENDVHVTDHANAISASHAQQGLFRVTVFGWSEIVRRLYDYPDLVKKHFSTYTLRQMQKEVSEATDQIIEKLNNVSVA